MCPSCATTLANNEVNEWYKDRQDPAITIKFKINAWMFDVMSYENTTDNFTHVVDCVIKQVEGDKILMQYHKRWQCYVFPWGKVDKWSDITSTIKREIKEECDLDVITYKELWSFKKIIKWRPHCMHMVELEVSGEAKNMEPEKHLQMVWAETIPSDNKLWFAVKIDWTLIDDDFEIMNQFYDLYIYKHNIAQQISDEKADVNLLAWTTTPRTLPSNMFLAVWLDIHYCMVYDKSTKEYYILAESLLKNYYKNPDEYVLVNILKGKDLVGITYEPLFPYINQSVISDEYKKQFFKIIPWSFVGTEDGTWIAHIAPSFWMDDFEAVAAFLPREDAKNWLFLPVDDYGEFTDEVPDFKWIRVYETNKDIIQRLKENKKLIWQKSYEHSYPHCRRCETPLIQKAITSRFIKEQELTKKTVPNAENISFVPETVKNRFRDTLNSAPDRNLSRNRYRWSPLPIWENINDQEDKIVAWTIEEIRRNTLEWSQNLTRNILIRHGRTPFNEENKHDCRGECGLTDLWKQEAEFLKSELNLLVKEDDESVIFISPLKRWRETILPYLSSKFWNEIKNIEKEYVILHVGAGTFKPV